MFALGSRQLALVRSWIPGSPARVARTRMQMPMLNASALTLPQVAAAYLIFLACYLVFAIGKFPGMRIDRPAAAVIGGVLMVAIRVVGPRDAIRSEEHTSALQS